MKSDVTGFYEKLWYLSLDESYVLVVEALCGEKTITVLPMVVVKSKNPYTVCVMDATLSFLFSDGAETVWVKTKLKHDTET